VLVAATLLHSVVGRNLAIIFDVEWGAVPLFVANPANGEFGSTIPTLADVHANVPDAEPFALGASYLDAIGVTVPRFIWPDRPMAAGEWYAAHFYPERWETGGAYGFSPVAEAYWNFGIFGVLLIPFVFGVALRWWEDQRMVTRRQPNLGTLAYVLAIPWLAFSWRLDAASVVKNYLVLTLIPALALLAAATVARGVASMHRQAIRLSGAT
jgi:hypothetical protein